METVVASSIVAITVWFFFIQSPFLFNHLGRAKFVPIMMAITKVFFKFILIPCIIQFLLAIARTDGGIALGPLVCLSGICINYFIIVPNALKAGLRSTKERNAEENNSVKDFVVEGGSKTETAFWHRLVIVFTLVMVAGSALNLYDLR